METKELATNESNKKFVFEIIKINLLTNFYSIILLFSDFKNGIGWLAGVVASSVNFYILSHVTFSMNSNSSSANAIRGSKTFFIRFAFLVVWSILVFVLIKPNIILYSVGLLSTQISIILYQIYHYIKNGF
jgi:hypothetical protein